MQKVIIGNWKMNGIFSSLVDIKAIAEASSKHPNVISGICLPSTLLYAATSSCPDFHFGGQDCHENETGAHTGCISAKMLSDAGAKSVILGHSERRSDNNESDRDVNAKAVAAVSTALTAIICVGETEEQRDAGQAEDIVLGQLSGSVPTTIDASSVIIAYEPVWAIGTGRIPSIDDVTAMHNAIRAKLIDIFGQAGNDIAILYGGSMNGGNAAELLAISNVNGGLVGGASLSADKFEPILAAAAVA